MKFFIPFLLALTFSLHAAQEGRATLPDHSLTSTSDEEASLASDEDQETDPPSTENESSYVVVSEKKPSPLMMFAEEGTEHSSKKPPLAADRTEQQRSSSEAHDSSTDISRSSHPVNTSEKNNNTSSPSTSEPCSLLFKTLTYCPGRCCQQWHTAEHIAREKLAKILFIKNLKTGFWHPLYRQDEQPATSLLKRARLQSMTPSLSRGSIERRNFVFVNNDLGEQVLHHRNPTTGVLEKSAFQDPIHELPAISYSTSILLQTRSLMPNALAHFFLIRTLEEKESIWHHLYLRRERESTPLLSKGTAHTNYASTSPEN